MHTTLRAQGCNRVASAKQMGDGLIMTATLNPPSSAVARSNPVDRLEDYSDALKFYLSLPDHVIDRILLVDNSDSDLSALHQLACSIPHAKIVELISFQGNDHPYQRGKAYGEFRLIDFGLAHTELFAPDDVVWKTTGRLKFLNLPAMLERSKSKPFDFLCDLHNIPWVGSGKWRNHENMDLRIFAFRMGAYDKMLKGIWQRHENGFDAELMYHTMLKNRGDFAIVPRFPLQPTVQGISGRHQRDYLSPGQRAKDGVRSIIRRISPGLWL